jgi:hypothetical protein
VFDSIELRLCGVLQHSKRRLLNIGGDIEFEDSANSVRMDLSNGILPKAYIKYICKLSPMPSSHQTLSDPFALSFNQFLHLSYAEATYLQDEVYKRFSKSLEDAWEAGKRQVVICDGKIVRV